MDRTNFYHTLVVDKVEELDFLWHSLSKFSMTYDPTYYRVIAADLIRPDMISYKCYGTVNFWWVILLVNGIENPFIDLQEGDLLKVPSKLDIYDFQKTFRVRRSR